MTKRGRAISWYTTVCDLKAARIHLFRKGDFSKTVVIDLKSSGLSSRKLD